MIMGGLYVCGIVFGIIMVSGKFMIVMLVVFDGSQNLVVIFVDYVDGSVVDVMVGVFFEGDFNINVVMFGIGIMLIVV